MKTIIGLAIGIVLTAAVIIPVSNAGTEARLEARKAQIELEQTQAELEALKAEQTAAITAEPQEVKGVPAEKPEKQAEPVAIPLAVETTPEPAKAAEVKATPEPKAETAPKAEQAKTASVYPKFFFENGQKYAYLTAYAEEAGIKTFIADEDEPNATQLEFYDWENDPKGKIPGPFNGNGSN
jgi:outer membrane biosynthesis protein TonB